MLGWEYPQYVYILKTSFSYGGKKLNYEKHNDTGRLIARELKQFYIQSVNRYIVVRPLSLIVAILLIMIIAYGILNINYIEITPSFIILEIGSSLLTIYFLLVAYYSKETSLRRCRMKIYERGFVPDERNKKRKPIFIFWHQVIDVKAAKYIWSAQKLTPATWYYTLITKTGDRYYLSSHVFPINKRKIISKLLEKKRLEIK